MTWKAKSNENVADSPTLFSGSASGQTDTLDAAGGVQDSI